MLQSGEGLEAVCYLYCISQGDVSDLTEAFNIETFLCGLDLEIHEASAFDASHEQEAVYDQCWACWQVLLHHDIHGRSLSSADLADGL